MRVSERNKREKEYCHDILMEYIEKSIIHHCVTNYYSLTIALTVEPIHRMLCIHVCSCSICMHFKCSVHIENVQQK